MSKITTAQQAIDRFRELAERGQVVNTRTGEPGAIAETTEAAIISTVCSAFRFASEHSDLDRVPYRAYAHHLDRFAAEDARARGLADASNRAARARRFVRTVEGIQREKRPSGIDALPEAWRPLFETVRAACSQEGRDRWNAGHLVTLAQAAALHGITSPADLPDRERLHAWLTDGEGGLAPDYASHVTRTFIRGRELHLEVHPEAVLPRIDRLPVRRERGLRGMDDICDRLEAAGCDAAPGDVDPKEVIRLLAPRWHQTMSAYLDGHRSNSPGWKKNLVGASSRVLAAFAEGEHGDLGAVDPCLLLLRRVEREDDEEEITLDDSPEVVALLGDDGASDLVEDGEEDRTEQLIYRLASDMAVVSSHRSPLTLRPGSGSDGDHWWTDTVVNDVRHLLQLAEWAADHSKALRGRRSWTLAVAEAREDFREIKAGNARAPLYGRKAKAMLLRNITYPIAVCMGLPALRREVLTCREHWDELHARFGDPEHRRVQAARADYDELLTRYLVTAIMLADGMRVGNYSGMRLGLLDERVGATAADGTHVESYTHVLPTVIDGELRAVQLKLHGDDHPRVKLKIEKLGQSQDWRRRSHHLRPGIVDHELLYDYLVRVRPERLAAQGLIPSPEAYDLEEDVHGQHFALFVSPFRSEDAYLGLTGGYTGGALSEMVGRMLHWMCSEALGRELPAWGSEELRTQYRALFSAHITRLLVGTYWFGIRDRAEIARAMTDDTTTVIVRRYSVVESDMVARVGWEEPRFFDTLMDRIHAGERIDWDQEASGPLEDAA